MRLSNQGIVYELLSFPSSHRWPDTVLRVPNVDLFASVPSFGALTMSFIIRACGALPHRRRRHTEEGH